MASDRLSVPVSVLKRDFPAALFYFGLRSPLAVLLGVLENRNLLSGQVAKLVSIVNNELSVITGATFTWQQCPRNRPFLCALWCDNDACSHGSALTTENRAGETAPLQKSSLCTSMSSSLFLPFSESEDSTFCLQRDEKPGFKMCLKKAPLGV